MNKADLVKIVGWRLGDRDDMVSRIDLELDYIQDYVLEAKPWHPWFLQSELSMATTTPGERRVPLPVDFLAEVEESHLYIVDPSASKSIELVKKDPDVAQKMMQGAEIATGFPRGYAISGLYFQFYPTPDDAYEIQMQYYAKDARISDSAASPKWLQFASDVVLAELCNVLAAKHIKDAEAAAGFAADAQVAWRRLYDKHTAMAELNQPRSLGGNS
jgi:hypothetical protein